MTGGPKQAVFKRTGSQHLLKHFRVCSATPAVWPGRQGVTSPFLQRAGQAQRGKVVARGARVMILTGKTQSRAPGIHPGDCWPLWVLCAVAGEAGGVIPSEVRVNLGCAAICSILMTVILCPFRGGAAMLPELSQLSCALQSGGRITSTHSSGS